MQLFKKLLLAIAISPFIASAQQPPTTPSVEITPFASYRFGGDFDDINNNLNIELEDGNGVGIITAWKYDTHRQGELLLSHYQSEFDTSLPNLNATDVAVSYLHLGGNVKLSSGLVPFWLSGGLGITHLSPDAKQLKDETNFSMSLGLSTKLSISESTKITLGGRIYGTLFDSESEIFCDSNDCAIFVESDVWVQSELMAGLTISF